MSVSETLLEFCNCNQVTGVLPTFVSMNAFEKGLNVKMLAEVTRTSLNTT